MKYCKRCDSTQPLENFARCKRSIDGRTWTCKTCIKAYQATIKDKLKEYQKTYQKVYRAEHRDELNSYLSTYLKTTGKERHRVYLDRWRAANPEKVKEYIKKSYERAKLKKQNGQ